jgi:hypothetical protein
MDVMLLVETCISGMRQPQDIENAVLMQGADVNAFHGTQSPLMRAVMAQRSDIVTSCLRVRADPNLPDAKGVSPLHMAVFDGTYETIQRLIDFKADVDKLDRVGQTPLFFAPHGQACQQLAQAGCNFNALNYKRQSALHLAAHAGLNETVLWLCRHCSAALINHQDEEGRTAVWCAALANLKPTIALLQEHGADVTVRPHRMASSHASTARGNLRTFVQNTQATASMTMPTTTTQAVPMATAVVTGVDMNRDGIPDVLQRSELGQASAIIQQPTQTTMLSIASSAPPPQEPQRRQWVDQTPSPDRKQRENAQSMAELSSYKTPGGWQGESYEMIVPKQSSAELRHLQDELRDSDQEVLSVLQTTLTGSSLVTAQPKEHEFYFSPSAAVKGWISSAPLVAIKDFSGYYRPDSPILDGEGKVAPAPNQLPPPPSEPVEKPSPDQEFVRKVVDEQPEENKALSESETKNPYVDEGAVVNTEDPDMGQDPDMDDAIKKIQMIQRARVERSREKILKKKAAVPIVSEDFYGAKTWEIVLTRHDNKSKYGFWHDNAKVELAKDYMKAIQQDENSPVDLNLLSPEERPEALIVKRIVKKGLLEEWNTIHPEAEVKPGDRVVKVNDATTIMDMQKELRSESCTCKVLRFPDIFLAQVDKSGGDGSVGFSFEAPANSELLVTEVQQGGVLDKANRANMRRGCHHLVVLPGMRIESVNNLSNDGHTMANELFASNFLNLRVRRAGVGLAAKPSR